MTEITLSQHSRFLFAQELSLNQKIQIKYCLRDALRDLFTDSQLAEAVEDAMNSRVCDLEDLLTVHYVPDNRNLSNISPIPPRDYLILYTREDFAPLLKALKEGDFELATVLTPANYRLIGYQEIKEEKKVEEQGQGWGGQYSVTVVPPGVYPVFTRSFAFNRERGLYESHLRDSDGVTTWLEGKCIRSSDDTPENHPFDRVYLGNPYAHSVAEDIWQGKGNITLIPPFEVVKITCISEEKEQDSFRIMDISLPCLLDVNPVKLRLEEDRFDNIWEDLSLEKQISSADAKKGGKPNPFGHKWGRER